jgi:drug/metabolite transporter (DMT)-like permease
MILGSGQLGTVLLTGVAMFAFAANSMLCRLALGAGLIDAASFAALRVAAGAVTLTLIAAPHWIRRRRVETDAVAAAMLLTYMVCFSFAYLSLAAGTGALVLFGAVQLTMFCAALRAGEPFSPMAWLGLSVALLGLVYLVSPGLTAPDPSGAALMAAAGVAWGIYSLRGRHATDALPATASNFVLILPAAAVVAIAGSSGAQAAPQGVALALLSGSVASGLGYVVWFAALRRLRATTAATVQLAVPAIAAVGGAALLGEDVTARLLLSSAATLGGIWIVLSQRESRRGPAGPANA